MGINGLKTFILKARVTLYKIISLTARIHDLFTFRLFEMLGHLGWICAFPAVVSGFIAGCPNGCDCTAAMDGDGTYVDCRGRGIQTIPET